MGRVQETRIIEGSSIGGACIEFSWEGRREMSTRKWGQGRFWLFWFGFLADFKLEETPPHLDTSGNQLVGR